VLSSITLTLFSHSLFCFSTLRHSVVDVCFSRVLAVPVARPRTRHPLTPIHTQEYNTRELDPSILEQWELAAQRLRDAGATVRAVSLPHTRHALGAYYLIATAEASSNLARYDGLRYGDESIAPVSETTSLDEQVRAYRSRGFGDEVQRRLLLGTFVLSKDLYGNYFEKATRVRRLVADDFARVFADEGTAASAGHCRGQYTQAHAVGVDADETVKGVGGEGVHVLLTPTTATTAPTVSEVLAESDPAVEYLADVMTVPSSLAGLPATSVPVGVCASTGLPIGLQVIGRRFDESTMFAVAQALEDRSGFRPLQW
jgi:aspartyl-tRNA(Asn)/glutamyl-tRNA(Gln) amidotransferase subunit A